MAANLIRDRARAERDRDADVTVRQVPFAGELRAVVNELDRNRRPGASPALGVALFRAGQMTNPGLPSK